MNGFLAELKVQQTINIFKECIFPSMKDLLKV